MWSCMNMFLSVLACMCVVVFLSWALLFLVNRLCVGSVIALVLDIKKKSTTHRFDRVDGVAPHTIPSNRENTQILCCFFSLHSLTRHINVFFFVCVDTIYMHRCMVLLHWWRLILSHVKKKSFFYECVCVICIGK